MLSLPVLFPLGYGLGRTRQRLYLNNNSLVCVCLLGEQSQNRSVPVHHPPALLPAVTIRLRLSLPKLKLTADPPPAHSAVLASLARERAWGVPPPQLALNAVRGVRTPPPPPPVTR